MVSYLLLLLALLSLHATSFTFPASRPHLAPLASQSESSSSSSSQSSYDDKSFSSSSSSPSNTSPPTKPSPVQLLTPSQRSQTYATIKKLRQTLPLLSKNQDFKSAAKVKKQLDRLLALDPYYSLEIEMELAVKKEWYRTAAKLKKEIDRIGGAPLDLNAPPPVSSQLNSLRETQQSRQSPSPSKNKQTKGDEDVRTGRFVEEPESESWKETEGISVEMKSKYVPGNEEGNRVTFSYSVKVRFKMFT